MKKRTYISYQTSRGVTIKSKDDEDIRRLLHFYALGLLRVFKQLYFKYMSL